MATRPFRRLRSNHQRGNFLQPDCVGAIPDPAGLPPIHPCGPDVAGGVFGQLFIGPIPDQARSARREGQPLQARDAAPARRHRHLQHLATRICLHLIGHDALGLSQGQPRSTGPTCFPPLCQPRRRRRMERSGSSLRPMPCDNGPRQHPVDTSGGIRRQAALANRCRDALRHGLTSALERPSAPLGSEQHLPDDCCQKMIRICRSRLLLQAVF